jgi:putative endonuclease
MSMAWLRSVPVKRPTEVSTHASEPYRINGQIIVVIARGMYPEAISIPYFMKPTVYILFNRPCGVLYTGVTSDLCKRMVEHKQRLQGFTARYNVTKLGYCEYFQDIKDAIQREKQIKAGNRKKRLN